MKKIRMKKSMEVDDFLDGEDVIFDTENEVTHVLNYSATIALQVRLKYDDMSYSPIEEFKKEVLNKLVDVNEAQLEDDFNEIMNEFIEKGILEIYDE